MLLLHNFVGLALCGQQVPDWMIVMCPDYRERFTTQKQPLRQCENAQYFEVIEPKFSGTHRVLELAGKPDLIKHYEGFVNFLLHLLTVDPGTQKKKTLFWRFDLRSKKSK